MLEVQELDSHAAQLRHQRATLPELAQIADLERARAELDGRVRDARILADDLTAEQAKVDADVEVVKARRKRDRDRMDQGLIADPKALERMQHELESLERRISSLEDDELEVMARLEDAQKDVDTLGSELEQTDERLAGLRAARDEKVREIDAQLARLAEQRAPLAADLPGDLVALYDRLREQKGGVGAAELRARQCGGCRLAIDNAELAVIRSTAADQVVRCEECQRILVRTGESGI